VLDLLHDLYQRERGARVTSVRRRAAGARGLFERLGRFTPVSFFVNRVPILAFPSELLEAVRTGRACVHQGAGDRRVGVADARAALMA
jgi:hypothetical protein